MKIGIFGDSYGAPYSDSIEAVSWTKLLKEKSNEYQVTNFAKGGTSLWWSYDLFIQNYDKFDTIIFVATDVGRLSNLIDGQGINNHDTALRYSEIIKNNNLNNLCDPKIKHTLKLLESAKDYFLYLQNFKQETFLHKKIIEELFTKIKQLTDKKIILIPGNRGSFPLNEECYFGNYLQDVTYKEVYVNFDYKKFKIETKYRANHLSKENNEILAEKIHQIIKGTCNKVFLNDFVFQKYDNPEKYWEI